MHKTVSETSGYHPYDQGLSREQKMVVNEAQWSRIINYKQDDQLQAVREIVQLFSVDSPVAIVTRLISSFNQVMQCKRRLKEDLMVFVPRFRSLAAYHLMHVGVSTTSQVSEILGITLLNNAMLNDETLTNAILQLFAHAKSKKHHESKDEVYLSKDAHRGMLEMLDKLSEHAFHVDALSQPSDNPNTVRHKDFDLVQGIQ